MFDIILFEPEIPPNTGNIIRLCAATGCRLHLIQPLGFDITDKSLRRAGLDYHEFADIRNHPDWASCRAALPAAPARRFAMTTKCSGLIQESSFAAGDAFIFGPESRGLPPSVLADFASTQRIRLPMLPERRSLNLANAVAVTVYEAWRQTGFNGGV